MLKTCCDWKLILCFWSIQTSKLTCSSMLQKYLLGPFINLVRHFLEQLESSVFVCGYSLHTAHSTKFSWTPSQHSVYTPTQCASVMCTTAQILSYIWFNFSGRTYGECFDEAFSGVSEDTLPFVPSSQSSCQKVCFINVHNDYVSIRLGLKRFWPQHTPDFPHHKSFFYFKSFLWQHLFSYLDSNFS